MCSFIYATIPGKNHGICTSRDNGHLVFYLAVNKQITDKVKKI